jgi:corrinoid protein of di/trimethylamine methyltransferase
MLMNETLYNEMAQSIIDGNVELAANLASRAVEAGLDPLEAINKGFAVGVRQVGEDFSNGTAFIPELVVSGAAMKAAMEALEPEIARRGEKRQKMGVVVLATVKGDIHDIGKNLVGTILSAYGFEVHDLGIDVPTSKIVDTARRVNADIVAVSALLTTTMMQQRKVVEALGEAGLRDKIKVIVGGAPVDGSWVEEIGADGFGEDAIQAVDVAKELLALD